MLKATAVYVRAADGSAEEALAESARYLELLFEAALAAPFDLNLRTRSIRHSPRLNAIAGLPRDAHPTLEDLRALCLPADLERLASIVPKAIAGERHFQHDVRITRNGELRWMHTRGEVILDDDGQPARVLGVALDITEQREALDALRRSDSGLRTLVENIRDYAIYGTDQQGIITDWTEGAARVTGYRAEDVVGRPVTILYLPDDVASGLPARELQEAAKAGRTEREAWKVRRDGGRFWANEITTAIRSADGTLTGFTIISRDLTVQKLLQEERQRQLERERRAREDAEAFLGVLSHELRTPVTSIYGTASLIAREPARDDLLELLNDVQEEAGRLARMIDDLLILSRVDRGLVQLAPEPILLQHAVSELVHDLRRQAPPAVFRLDVPQSLPPVIADATALRQVLYNLLTNAVKYAGSEGPISVTARPKRDTVDLFVLDEGPGLGPDPSAVFSLFYRAPHTAQRASGTGIGLYVARGLMHAMGGSIDARTRETGGALFRLTLPTARDD